MHIFRIENPGQLIGALPAMIGFAPSETLAVLLMTGPVACQVLLHTLPDSGSSRSMVIPCGPGTGPTGAIIVAVTSRYTGDAAPLTVAAANELLSHGINVHSILSTATITAGSSWTDLVSGETGDVTDPQTSPATLAAIASGRVVAASLAEIAARYEPAPDPVTPAPVPGHTFAATVLRDLRTAATASTGPSTSLISAAAGMATQSRLTRDAMLGTGAGSDAAAQSAAALFTVIAARTRGVARTELLSLTAVFACACGDVPAATCALDAAAAATPDRAPSTLHTAMTAALAAGVPSSAAHRCLTTCAGLAAHFTTG